MPAAWRPRCGRRRRRLPRRERLVAWGTRRRGWLRRHPDRQPRGRLRPEHSPALVAAEGGGRNHPGMRFPDLLHPAGRAPLPSGGDEQPLERGGAKLRAGLRPARRRGPETTPEQDSPVTHRGAAHLEGAPHQEQRCSAPGRCTAPRAEVQRTWKVHRTKGRGAPHLEGALHQGQRCSAPGRCTAPRTEVQRTWKVHRTKDRGAAHLEGAPHQGQRCTAPSGLEATPELDSLRTSGRASVAVLPRNDSFGSARRPQA